MGPTRFILSIPLLDPDGHGRPHSAPQARTPARGGPGNRRQRGLGGNVRELVERFARPPERRRPRRDGCGRTGIESGGTPYRGAAPHTADVVRIPSNRSPGGLRERGAPRRDRFLPRLRGVRSGCASSGRPGGNDVRRRFGGPRGESHNRVPPRSLGPEEHQHSRGLRPCVRGHSRIRRRGRGGRPDRLHSFRLRGHADRRIHRRPHRREHRTPPSGLRPDEPALVAATVCQSTAPDDPTKLPPFARGGSMYLSAGWLRVDRGASVSEYEALAKNVIRRTLHIQPKENVIVETWNHGLPIATEVVYQVRAAGARPMLLFEDEDTYWKSVNTLPESKLGQVGSHEWKAMSEADGYVFIPGPADITKIREAGKKFSASTAYNDEWYRRAKRNRLRGARLGLGYVTEGRARSYGFDLPAWRAMVLEASSVDGQQIVRIGRKVTRELAKKGRLEITHPNGTRFSCDLVGRPAGIEDGIVTKEDLDAGG